MHLRFKINNERVLPLMVEIKTCIGALDIEITYSGNRKTPDTNKFMVEESFK